jgi:hypothetical protein
VQPPFLDEYKANSGMAADGLNGHGFVTGHDLSRAVCRQFGIPAKQAAEKGLFPVKIDGNIPQGLKPALIPSDLRHD